MLLLAADSPASKLCRWWLQQLCKLFCGRMLAFQASLVMVTLAVVVLLARFFRPIRASNVHLGQARPDAPGTPALTMRASKSMVMALAPPSKASGPWVSGGVAAACLLCIVVIIWLLPFLASKAGWVVAMVCALMLCKALLQNFITTLHLEECAVRLGSQRLLHWLRECQAKYTKLFNAIQLLVHVVMFVVAQLINFVHAIHWSAYVIIYAAVQLVQFLVHGTCELANLFAILKAAMLAHQLTLQQASLDYSGQVTASITNIQSNEAAIHSTSNHLHTLLLNSSDQAFNVNGQLINLNNIVATVQHNLHTAALASQQLAQVVDGPQLAMHIANLQVGSSSSSSSSSSTGDIVDAWCGTAQQQPSHCPRPSLWAQGEAGVVQSCCA
ncbi:hypothetical protein COO60DRAFT_932672 [Scenedesmus sp. NREL 46B-D3]|nr:hypothetical protein COO60DRAFT_932672 [Scenedesmus sp. NREL 46B-D3]